MFRYLSLSLLFLLFFCGPFRRETGVVCQSAMNNRRSLRQLYTPVREYVCAGKASPAQLDRIRECRSSFRRTIRFPEAEIEYQTKLKDCMTMNSANSVSFPVEERHRDLIFSICVPSFRQCLFRSSRNRVPKLQVSKAIFQANLSNMMECQKKILFGDSGTTTSSST